VAEVTARSFSDWGSLSQASASWTSISRNFIRSSKALSSLNRWKARRRAAFWRSLGFPNLVRARAAKAKKREQRLRLERIQAAKRFSPFAMIDDLSSYNDLFLAHPSKARWSKKPQALRASIKA